MTQAIKSAFKTDQPNLRELLDWIHEGTVQLPDFQRGWVWEDHRIRALVASVSLSYPIGAAMFMETGGDASGFAPRLFEGVDPVGKGTPDRLVLDGQQRLTSMYLALRSGKPVATRTAKKKDVERIYYLDMKGCLSEDADRVDAIVGVPSNKVVRTNFNRDVELDVSTREKEYANDFYPLSIVFDNVESVEWSIGYQLHHNHEREKLLFFNAFQQQVLQRFLQYKLPIIELLRDTPKDAICQVFENVNTGGVALTVFELMTAMFAADGFRLRPDWEERGARIHERPVLRGFSETDFIQAVTLLSSYRRNERGEGAVGCKRKDMLRLSLFEYKAHADDIEHGLREAERILIREKIFSRRNLPYQSQLVPLATICAILGDRVEEDGVKRKLARWYWSGVLGELYGGATEARFALDAQQVPAWIDGGPEPRSITDASFSPNRLLTLQTRQSAAYKGLMARLMRAGALDLRTGDPIELTTHMEDSVDIHHLFPKAHCQKLGFPRTHWNSFINKAPLTARTNRMIGGKAPSAYLAGLEDAGTEMSQVRMDEILATHLVDPEIFRADDFRRFVRDRATKLLDEIELALGKSVSGRDTDEVVEGFGGPLIGHHRVTAD